MGRERAFTCCSLRPMCPPLKLLRLKLLHLKLLRLKLLLKLLLKLSLKLLLPHAASPWKVRQHPPRRHRPRRLV